MPSNTAKHLALFHIVEYLPTFTTAQQFLCNFSPAVIFFSLDILSTLVFIGDAMTTNHSKGTPDLVAVRSALLKPTEKEQTQWELILSLQDAIEAARDAGKTVEQMHRDLTACGVDIRFGTFRKYVSDLLYEPPAKRNKRPSRPQVPAPQSTVTANASSSSAERSLRNIRGGKSFEM
jgi:hypothetical protein